MCWSCLIEAIPAKLIENKTKMDNEIKVWEREEKQAYMTAYFLKKEKDELGPGEGQSSVLAGWWWWCFWSFKTVNGSA